MPASFPSLVTPFTSRDVGLADNSLIFTATNPTPGTGVAGHAAATTFDQTKALLYLYNAGLLNIYPLNLRLKLTSAGVAGTTVRFTQVIDKGTNRLVTAVGPVTPLNTNMGSSVVSGASGNNLLAFGANVLTAASGAARTICDCQYRTVIGVVGDTYQFVWGSPVMGLISSVPTSGTLIADITVGYPSIVIPPNAIFAIHQWSASQSTAYSFEFEFDYAEK